MAPPSDSRGMRLDDLTSEEFASSVRPDTVVILPIGSIEAHGRHLPLGSDPIQPMHALAQVAERTGALVAPPIPYGVLTSTRPFPSSIGVSFDALRAFVRDLLRDLVRQGVRRVMIVSGHAAGAHLAALREAPQEVVDEGSLRATVLSDYDLIYASGLVPEGEGHAGMAETSRLLVHRPDLVKGVSPKGENRTPPYAVVADARPYWPSVTGDPSKATKDYGQELDRLIVDGLARLVDELRRRP